MKIAVNTRFLLKNKLEGIGWFSFEILKRLVQNHPDITFYFLFDRPWDPSFVFGPNVIPVNVYPPARHPFLFYAWFEFSVPLVLKRIKPDAFISTDGFLSIHARVKTLLWWHDITYKYFPESTAHLAGKYYEYFVPRFLTRANRIITFSQHAASELIQRMHVPAEKIVASSGAARKDFQPVTEQIQLATRNKYSDGKPYFLYVGALQPRKNIQALIEAFDQFKSHYPSEIKLLLVGRLAWKYEGILKSYQNARHKSDILFLGHIGSELPAITASAYASVYPSLYEGFGLPVIESIQCGVPVITSNCSSMPEVCGNAGLLVDPLKVDSIAEAMREIVQNVALYHTLKANCPAQAMCFNWDNTAEAVYRALCTMLNTQSA